MSSSAEARSGSSDPEPTRSEGGLVERNSIFRKVALDRLASPERLDELLTVTDARAWMALAAASMLLVTAVVWGVLGRIPQTVTGAGILIKSGGLFEVAPIESGRITDLAVTAGEVVSEGQVVARIAQPELTERLRQSKADLSNLRRQHSQLIEYSARDLALQTASLAQQRVTVEQSIADAQRNLASCTEKLNVQERLAEEGLMTRLTLVDTRQQCDTVREKIGEDRVRLAQITVNDLELRNRRVEQLRVSETRTDEREREIAQLERESRGKTEVVAPQTGRILEILTEPGAFVARGEPILTLDLAGRSVKDLEAVIYVPSGQGKQVRAGMLILIAPATVKEEEYGLMMGKVTYVSDFPATVRGMQKLLKNEKLALGLAGSDAPYEVRADLTPDPQTPSGYRWTSSGGPALRIQSGTLASARITVATRKPIEMLLPLVRERTGL